MSADQRTDGVWPALFAQLTPVQRCAVVDTLASGWHEGWAPTRSDVESLELLVNGSIDPSQYRARVLRVKESRFGHDTSRADGNVVIDLRRFS